MRLSRLVAMSALSLAGLLLASVSAPGEEALINPPPLNESVLGADAVKEIQEYVDQMPGAFDALDKIINEPPRDPSEAGTKFSESCAAMSDALARAWGTARKKTNGQPLPDSYEKWFSAQEAAWALTNQRGTRVALLSATFNESIRKWKQDWIKKLPGRKKDYLALGEELNGAYHHLVAAAAIRKSEEDWKKEARSFEKVLTLAENVGRDLRNFKSRLIDDVAQSAPGVSLHAEWSALIVELKTPSPLLPQEGIWLLHYGTWEATLVERMKTAVEVFEKVLVETEPIRKQTLFKDLGEPIAGLHFSEIHPKWRELYDRLLKDYAAIQERVKVEEDRWKEDRERVMELINETGATEARRLRLKAANADSPAKRRDISQQAARETGPDAYQKLFRKMVEDKAYSMEEMEKRATPEFLAEWDRILKKSKADEEAKYRQLEKDEKAVEDEIKEFEELIQANGKEIEKIEKDNARRRNELGLGEKPFNR